MKPLGAEITDASDPSTCAKLGPADLPSAETIARYSCQRSEPDEAQLDAIERMCELLLNQSSSTKLDEVGKRVAVMLFTVQKLRRFENQRRFPKAVNLAEFINRSEQSISRSVDACRTFLENLTSVKNQAEENPK